VEPQTDPQSVLSDGAAFKEKTKKTLARSHCPDIGGAWTGEPDLVVGFHE